MAARQQGKSAAQAYYLPSKVGVLGEVCRQRWALLLKTCTVVDRHISVSTSVCLMYPACIEGGLQRLACLQLPLQSNTSSAHTYTSALPFICAAHTQADTYITAFRRWIASFGGGGPFGDVTQPNYLEEIGERQSRTQLLDRCGAGADVWLSV